MWEKINIVKQEWNMKTGAYELKNIKYKTIFFYNVIPYNYVIYKW